MKISSLYYGLFYLFFIAFCSSLLFGQTFPVNNVIINGANDKRINIVFLSEGYALSEMDQFNQDVQNAINDLFNASPYKEYQSYFNIYSIEAPSNESGTDHPGTANDEPQGLPTFTKDSYFNSTFDFAGIHRLLVPQYSKVYSVLQINFPVWDIAFLIVNHPWYGGSGGVPATFSLDPSSSKIAIHELGHSFALLADEYETGGLPGKEARNATAETARDSIKWNSWIDATTPIPTPENSSFSNVIGLFEGAVYNPTGWYRPKLDCKMRTIGVPYCEVCSEQTILSIYNLLNTIEAYQPSDTSLTLYDNTVLDFVIQKMQPISNTIKTEWYLDEQLTAVAIDTFTFDASLIDIGKHKIKVRVTDTTETVRNDQNSNLTTFIAWQILVEKSVKVNNGNIELPKDFQLYQNYPNPFNPKTKIQFDLIKPSNVRIDIYNLQGQKIRTLVNESKPAGSFSVVWDGKTQNGELMASGVYIYRMKADVFEKSRKLLFIK